MLFRSVRIKPEVPLAELIAHMSLLGSQVAEADQHLQTGLQLFSEDPPGRAEILCRLIVTSGLLGDDNRTAGYWTELTIQQPGGEWMMPFVNTMVSLVRSGETTLVKKLIAQSGDRPELFPLRRALEYLDTHDRDLIERLSPEVRGVVEDIVKRLELAPQKQQGRS